MFTLLPLALKWTRYNGGLVALIAIGLMVAAILSATAVLLWGILREASLSELLDTSGQENPNLALMVTESPTNFNFFSDLKNETLSIIDSKSEGLLQQKSWAVRSETLNFKGESSTKLKDRRSFLFSSDSDLGEEHLSVIGNYPSSGFIDIEDVISIEGLISNDDSVKFSISVGDEIFLEMQSGAMIQVKVSGFYRPVDPTDPFWVMYEENLMSGNTDTVATLPILISRDTYFSIGSNEKHVFKSSYVFKMMISRDVIRAETFELFVDEIISIHNELTVKYPTASLKTSLLNVLNDFREKLIDSKVAMTTLLFLFVVFTFIYVFSVTNILYERQSAYYDLLRLRGSGHFMPMIVISIPILVSCVIAAVIGPIGSYVMFKIVAFILGLGDLFSDIPISLYFTQQTWLASGSAVIFGFLILATRLISRGFLEDRSVSIFDRTENSRVLSILFTPSNAIIFVLLIAFWTSGGLDNPIWTSLGGDSSLGGVLGIFVPIIFLIVASLLSSRMLPTILLPIDLVFSKKLNPSIALALKFLLRAPANYSGVLLMVSVTVAIAVVSVSFIKTLEVNEKEQISYQVGSDVRLEGVVLEESRFSNSAEQSYMDLPWIYDVTPVYRETAYDADNPSLDPYEVMAIDIEKTDVVSLIREDFFEGSLESTKDLLKASRESGLKLPDEGRTIALNIRPDKPMPHVQVHVKLIDAAGRFYTHRVGWLGMSDYLGNLREPEWMTLYSPLKPLAKKYRPYSLMSIGFSGDSQVEGMEGGGISLESISSSVVNNSPDGGTAVDTIVVEDFSDDHQWIEMLGSTPPEAITLSEGQLKKSLYFSWPRMGIYQTQGVRHSAKLGSVPALISRNMTQAQDYQVGDTFLAKLEGTTVNFKVMGILNYFPTVNTNFDDLVLVDLDTLRFHLNLDPIANSGNISEMWIDVDETVIGDDISIDSLKFKPFETQYLYDQGKMTAGFVQDPLRTAGWRILFTVSLISLAFLTTLYFWTRTVNICKLRLSQAGVLENLGMTKISINLIQWVESTTVLFIGSLFGLWIGGFIGQLIMPVLGKNENGHTIMPPFQFVYSWGPVLVLIAVLIIFCALSLVVAHRFYARYSPAETLRSSSEIQH